MLSPPDNSDSEPTQQTTPKETAFDPSPTSLSSPDSNHSARRTMPSAAAGSNGANSNGKRPINTISNGHDDLEGRARASTLTHVCEPTMADRVTELAAMGNNGGKLRTDHTDIAAAPQQQHPPKTHAASGYEWTRVEDEPGYAWTNKKAMDEAHRAWAALVHVECAVKSELNFDPSLGNAQHLADVLRYTDRYGDPFEAVEREMAINASLKET